MIWISISWWWARVRNSTKGLYINKSTNNYGLIIYLYVYDFLVTKNNMKEVYVTKKYWCWLSYQSWEKQWGLIVMSHYVEKVLLKFDHLKFGGAKPPCDSSIKILKSSSKAIARLECTSAI